MQTKRPVALILFVLVVDLGLAAAGAVLLGKGLAPQDKKVSPAPAKPAQKTEAPARPAAVMAAAPAPPRAATLAAAAAAPGPPDNTAATPESPAAATPSKPNQKSTKTSAARDARGAHKPAQGTADQPAAGVEPARPVTVATPAPEDPYDRPSLTPELEIERLAASSKGAFDRCLGAVAPVHGSIAVAFRVMPDGRVAHAAPVENTTGSGELAHCLTNTIATWRVSPHSGPTLDLVRPFTYP